jgi:hypothetical protein
MIEQIVELKEKKQGIGNNVRASRFNRLQNALLFLSNLMWAKSNIHKHEQIQMYL